MKELYFDLMKKCLTDLIYADVREKFNFQGDTYDESKRNEGRDWPVHAHTMIGMKRLDNLQFCVEDVISKNVPGDLVETGVWRGGATIFMRAILKAYAITDRCVWVADSFAGLPVPNPEKYPTDFDSTLHEFPELAISLETVKNNFAKYNLLDEQVQFLKGWFRDTMPNASIKEIAVLRLDGDMYESTWDVLENLYPKVSKGGYIIIDDYGAIPACSQAVEDYRKANSITDKIYTIDWTGIYWQRS